MMDNKMEKIADMFGKKLNEKFVIQDADRLDDKKDAWFTEYGFTVVGADNRYIDVSALYLEELLVGTFVVVDD